MTNSVLSPEARDLVVKETNRVLAKWLTIAGVSNVVVVFGLITYLFTTVPEDVAGEAAEMVIEETKNRTANLREELEDEHADVFGKIGEVRANTEQAAVEVAMLGQSLGDAKRDLQNLQRALGGIQQQNLGSVVALISDLKDSDTLPALLSRISELESEIRAIGSATERVPFTINGPRIGGADKQECPSGSFVSSIHASGSVGGKYGVDGISQITFSCTPLK